MRFTLTFHHSCSFFVSAALLLSVGCNSEDNANHSKNPGDTRREAVIGDEGQEMDSPYDGTTGRAILLAPEDVMASAPYATEWKEVDFSDQQYMFSISHLPAFGISRITIQGWVFQDFNQRWVSILHVNTHGVGNAELNVDSEEGMLQVVGAANNKLKGKPIVQFDLNATVR